MTDFPSFAEFFTATTNGHSPFPWQARLAAHVTEKGWPSAIGVPTGMGKTACVDIAVWALARDIALRGAARAAATRTWYVVNRRLLVDRAYERGLEIQRHLVSSSVPAVAEVATALRSISILSVDTPPLQVLRLRGGADLGVRPSSPSEPTLIFATVPMFASRLLFRGYGSSNTMQPVDAALAGIDSLVLLDEAHLSVPLMGLAGVIPDCDAGNPELVLAGRRGRPVLVSLTATGVESGDRFDLDGADLEHPVIARRLGAYKPTRVVDTKRSELADTMANEATSLVGDSPERSCVVFCNTVSLASNVAKRLTRALQRETIVLTGRLRDREAERVRALLIDPQMGVASGRPRRRAGEIAPVVVATQTLEVGADLDFDCLVTETAGVRALTQRFGRLNRLGETPAPAAVICHPIEPNAASLYGSEPIDVRSRLADYGELLNLAPSTIRERLGEPRDSPDRTGQLLPSHLWEFAKTSFREPGEPPVELFFDAIASPSSDVSVVWRACVPEAGERLHPAVSAGESIEVPIAEVREALKRRDIETATRLAIDRATVEGVEVGGLKPGDIVLIPAAVGMYSRSGWDPESTEPVMDLTLLDGFVWIDPEFLKYTVQVDEGLREAAQQLRAAIDADEMLSAEIGAATSVFRDELSRAKPHPWVAEDEFAEALQRVAWNKYATDLRGRHWLEPKPRWGSPRARSDNFDDLSFDAAEVESRDLAHHLRVVGELSDAIARKIGLDPGLRDSLGIAARWHDAGKFDIRFQQWLDPDGEELMPIAKSRRPAALSGPLRAASGWPIGARHELLSGRLLGNHLATASTDSEINELALHLVLSHHGHGRPWIRSVVDSTAFDVVATIDRVRVAASGDLAMPDLDQPARFRNQCARFGYWGTALLEAIIRQADHLASGRAGVA